MKLITLHQPWASAMALGIKAVETRGWPTIHRGKLAVHAALAWNKDCRKFARSGECWEPFHKILGWSGLGSFAFNGSPERERSMRCKLPFGAVIAVCDLIDCRPASPGVHLAGWSGALFNTYPELDTPTERVFGNYEPGRYGLVTANMRRLREPIPWKSRQGKLLDWEPPANLEDLYV